MLTSLSLAEARRLALAAQGFDRQRPAHELRLDTRLGGGEGEGADQQ